MDTIIIAVDLGHFKAYKTGRTRLGKSKMQLIEDYDSIEAHEKIADKLTDQAGRFSRPSAKGGVARAKGYGEPHNFELEEEKKMISRLAKNINTLLSKETYETWCLAAPAEINSRIVANLKPEIKEKLAKNVSCNLTRSKKSELIERFGMCQPQPA